MSGKTGCRQLENDTIVSRCRLKRARPELSTCAPGVRIRRNEKSQGVRNWLFS